MSESSITSREIDIIRLIAKGKTTREIAVHLKAKESSVEKWRGDLLDKVNVHNSAELVSWAYQCNILKVK